MFFLDDDYINSNSHRGLKIRDNDKNIIVEAVVAGIPTEQVEVNIEDGVLTVKAENKTEDSSYQYYYTTTLSGGDWQKAEADVKHGILTVTIPKAEAAKPKKITVKAK